MPTPLEVARSFLGYVEQGGAHGNDGNVTSFWDWWDAQTGERDQGASWCGAFVSFCFDSAGSRFTIGAKPGFIYCPAGEAWFRSQGLLVDAAHAQPGDVAFFHFQGEATEANHTGLIEAVDPKNRTVTSIEGNTTAGTVGNQANGGGVYRRTRPWSCVRSVGHAAWVHPTAKEDHVGTKTVTVNTDPKTGKGLAAVPGVTPDKAFSATAITGDDGSVAKVGINPNKAPDGTIIVNVDLGVPSTLVSVPVGVVVGFNS